MFRNFLLHTVNKYTIMYTYIGSDVNISQERYILEYDKIHALQHFLEYCDSF